MAKKKDAGTDAGAKVKKAKKAKRPKGAGGPGLVDRATGLVLVLFLASTAVPHVVG